MVLRRMVILSVLYFCAEALFAQPRLTVSSTSALIGDKITLSIAVPPIAGSEWINPDVIPADTVDAIQVLVHGNPQIREGDRAVIKEWTIAVYDTGFVRVPPVPVIMLSGRGADTFWTNDIPLRIEGVRDSTGMAPIKPINYEPVRFSDYVPYLIGLAVLIALILGGIWWRRRPKKEKEEEIIEEIIPPHVTALEELRLLEEQKLWQEGRIKEYHMQLSHILRAYLEERYGVAALESTTSEVRQMLKPLLSTEHFNDMMPMMEIEDLIKFAKAQPPVEIHAQHLNFARQFVLNTKRAVEILSTGEQTVIMNTSDEGEILNTTEEMRKTEDDD